MNKRFLGYALFLSSIVVSLQACSSSDQKAAIAAGIAENALNQGQLGIAQLYVKRALAARDDVSDYWLLAAHIDLAANDSAGAFDAYATLLTLDRGNQEALAALCSIALANNDPARAEQYAAQLTLLQPSNLLPPTIKAGMALRRGDKDDAERQLEEILKKQSDFIPALILRSKLLISEDRFAEAAKQLEDSLKGPGEPDARLFALQELYLKAKDRDGYRRTVVRLANSKPSDTDRQLTYADMLYDEEHSDQAYAIVQRVQALKPDDIGVAATILDLWLKHRNVLPAGVIVRDAANKSLEAKATYAQYADEIGHPELALAILGPGTAVGTPEAANSDAKTAYAYAIGMRGNTVAAMAQLGAVIDVDPTHPRALIARARLAGDLNAAVEDARKVVSDDDKNMLARLTLADLLLRRKDAILAETTLRAGVTRNPGDLRAASRLIRLLRAQGRTESIAAVVNDVTRANPFSLRASKLGEGP